MIIKEQGKNKHNEKHVNVKIFEASANTFAYTSNQGHSVWGPVEKVDEKLSMLERIWYRKEDKYYIELTVLSKIITT